MLGSRDLPELKYLPRTIQDDEGTDYDRRNDKADQQKKPVGLRRRDVAKDHLDLLGDIVDEMPGM